MEIPKESVCKDPNTDSDDSDPELLIVFVDEADIHNYLRLAEWEAHHGYLVQSLTQRTVLCTKMFMTNSRAFVNPSCS